MRLSKRTRCLLTVVGMCVGLVSCATHRVQPVATSGGDAARLIPGLLERAQKRVLLDGVLRVSGKHGDSRLRARAIAVVEPGGRLYLETVGQPAFVLASDGERIRVILPGERQWFDAPATAATIEALIGLPIDPPQLGALLAGIGLSAEKLAGARSSGGDRLLVDGGWARVDPAAGHVIAGELGGLTFTIDPGERRTQIEVAERDLLLKLRWSRIEGDEPAPRDPVLFRPVAPEGFEELDFYRLRRPILLPVDEEPA